MSRASSVKIAEKISMDAHPENIRDPEDCSSLRHSPRTGRDGMGWDGMGWDGMGWDGMGWDGMGWDGMRWNDQLTFNKFTFGGLDCGGRITQSSAKMVKGRRRLLPRCIASCNRSLTEKQNTCIWDTLNAFNKLLGVILSLNIKSDICLLFSLRSLPPFSKWVSFYFPS